MQAMSMRQEELDNKRSIIGENEFILIKDNRDNTQVICLKQTRKIKMRRMQIMVGSLVGQPFDKVFDVDKAGNLVPTEDFDFVNLDNEWQTNKESSESEESGEEEEEKDNRNLFDHNTAQKLTNEEILEMKRETLSLIHI
eukprot:TRINITY_DN10820_c0_g1_i1.p1 TRINITY_DN10820_c0_g1~~TRINITY_DN10820_c0_g1_i1.p1  ORF type:complete len:140 (-),score=45.62 TRINITY_DN10820_c0_g1_i1:3-422(-)